MDPNTSISIISDLDIYLSDKSKTLEERISEITLDAGVEENIEENRLKKIILDKALSLTKIGSIVSEMLNWNNGLAKEINDLKKNALLAEYFNKNDQNEAAVSALRNFITNPQGNALFNKVIRIVDENPPDKELIEHLSTALKYIVDSDFVNLFSSHRYALAQIEQISPQALAILADRRSWPTMKLPSYSSNGTQVESDWLSQFSSAYSDHKGILDKDLRNRVKYSVSELQTRKTIEAHLTGNDGVAVCRVTDIGGLIIPYIDLET